MKEFLEIVFSKYKDPKIAMWMKNVLVLIMLLNFCVGLLYPMEQKKTVLPMFLSMILLLSVNCALSRGKDYTWLDTVTFLLLIAPNLHLFHGGDIGYFSTFYIILYSVGAVFILGIRTSALFNAVCAFFIFVQVRGSGLAELRGLYHQNLLLLILVYCRNCVYYYVFYSAVLGGKRKKPAGSGTQNP